MACFLRCVCFPTLCFFALLCIFTVVFMFIHPPFHPLPLFLAQHHHTVFFLYVSVAAFFLVRGDYPWTHGGRRWGMSTREDTRMGRKRKRRELNCGGKSRREKEEWGGRLRGKTRAEEQSAMEGDDKTAQTWELRLYSPNSVWQMGMGLHGCSNIGSFTHTLPSEETLLDKRTKMQVMLFAYIP